MKARFHHKTKAVACLLTFCLMFSQAICVQAAAIRKTDVEAASNGNILVGVEGNFEKINTNEVLKRINAIRKEACQKGYVNPENGKKLKMSDTPR